MTTFLTTFAIYLSYSASIVISLIQSPSKTIQSLDNFFDSQLDIGMHTIEHIERKVFAANDTILQKLFRSGNKASDDISNRDELFGINQVQINDFGFLIDAPIGYQATSKSFTESGKFRINVIR